MNWKKRDYSNFGIVEPARAASTGKQYPEFSLPNQFAMRILKPAMGKLS